jgi:ribosomal RNA-processing protein 7
MVPMPKEKTATRAHNFVILPLRYPAVPAFPRESAHYLYLRSNAPKVPTDDTPRELFLVNVPVDATESHLRSLFADQLGGARVEGVEFEDTRVVKGIKAPVVRHEGERRKKRKRVDEDGGQELDGKVGLLPDVWDRELHRSGGTAVARFVDRASAKMALREANRAVKSGKEIVWGAGVEGKVPPLGSARYLAHHKLRYPDPALLQASVDSFMEAFSAQEAERARQLARRRSIPDEDGFITVTRGGRTGPAREEEAKAKEEELKKREKNRVKDDFYRFQVREKKKEAAKELVKGFEEDRKKVEEMRKRRGKIRPE